MRYLYVEGHNCSPASHLLYRMLNINSGNNSGPPNPLLHRAVPGLSLDLGSWPPVPPKVWLLHLAPAHSWYHGFAYPTCVEHLLVAIKPKKHVLAWQK